MEIDIGQYEVLPGKLFSHMAEPAISFSKKAIWINMGCLKSVPDTFYVHFLLFRIEKSLIIKPCAGEERDAVRWCTFSGKPRNILCNDDIWIDITSLMGWNDHDRYRLLGHLVHSSGWSGLAFDMTRAIVISRSEAYDEPQTQSCHEAAEHPSWAEYSRNPLVKRFAEDTRIVTDEEERSGETIFTASSNPD